MLAESLRIGVVGAEGRLGSRVVAECLRTGVPVVWTATRRDWEDGQDHRAAGPTVVIDASSAAVLDRTAAFCRDSGAALLACVSDLGPAQLASAADLAAHVPVVRAVNLSVGHWLQQHLLRTVGRLADLLPDRPVASILERHTAVKADRPSVSALALADTWNAVHPRETVREIASYRAGLPVSEHVVELTFRHETLALRHDVRDLGAAAAGALLVAAWTQDAAPGLHTTSDVFDRLFLPSDG